MANKKLEPTNITALTEIGRGELVELDGWTDGKPFVCRLRRASLTGMIKAGKIPNPLIGAAQKLYEGAKSKSNASFEETAKVVGLVVEQAMVEPTYEQLTSAGLSLTEQQTDQIYLYAIQGPKKLEAFRAFAANNQPNPAGDNVQGQTQQPAGN